MFWLTMGIGCGLSGIAGGLIAPVLAACVPMGNSIFIRCMTIVFVGGMGSMPGAMLAALIVGMTESIGFQFIGPLVMVLLYFLMAVLLYFRPGGLLGTPYTLPGAVD